MSKDPLLQPYQLKHLTLRNRIMTTSHEPAYPEDGMPKARYVAYHAERAKAGVAQAPARGEARERAAVREDDDGGRRAVGEHDDEEFRGRSDVSSRSSGATRRARL